MNISEKMTRLIRLGMEPDEAAYFVNDLLLQGIAMAQVRLQRQQPEAEKGSDVVLKFPKPVEG